MQQFSITPPNNQLNRGVLFLDQNRPYVFGKVNISGADLRLRGIIETEAQELLIRGEVIDSKGPLQLLLSPTHAKGAAPGWVGILRANANPAREYRVAGYLSKSKERGIAFLKLALYPKQDRNLDQLTLLEHWSTPPNRGFSSQPAYSL